MTHTGDFNRDGKADLVWRNSATGHTEIWLMDGLAPYAHVEVLIDPKWMVTHSADLNGDGMTDLIWRNLDTGQTLACLITGLTCSSFQILTNDPDWAVHPAEGH